MAALREDRLGAGGQAVELLGVPDDPHTFATGAAIGLDHQRSVSGPSSSGRVSWLGRGDGNSVVIGGLLSEDKATLITKVPLLGSIPLGLSVPAPQRRGHQARPVIEVTPRILAEQQ